MLGLILLLLLLLGLCLLLGTALRMHRRFLTALCERGLDGLHHINLGVSLERGIEVALHGPTSACIVVQHDMVDATESGRGRGRRQGACEVLGHGARRTALLLINSCHAGMGLFIHAVGGMTGIEEAGDGRRFSLGLGCLEGGEGGRTSDSVRGELMVLLELPHCRLGPGAEGMVGSEGTAVSVGVA